MQEKGEKIFLNPIYNSTEKNKIFRNKYFNQEGERLVS